MATKNWTKYTFPRKSLNDGSSDWWTSSGSGTSEYYYNQTDVSYEPISVWANNGEMVRGVAGSLNQGEWDYADNDSIGNERIYVRLSDDSDPDTKSAGYMECSQTFTIINEGSGVTPDIVSIILSNLDNTYDAIFWVYKTASDDTIEFQTQIVVPSGNSPVDWLTKLFLNDSDKLKVQTNRTNTSIMISGDA